MKFAPLFLLAMVLVLLAGCSTAANRRVVHAPYQQPMFADTLAPDWESQKRTNQPFPSPSNDRLPPLASDWTPE